MKRRDNNVIRIDSVVEGDFRSCDLTQSQVFHKLLSRMGPEDRMLLISISGKHLRIMEKPMNFKDGLVDGALGMARGIYGVLGSQTYRVTDGGKWTPIHIKNLFERKGLLLVNYEAILKHFGYQTNHGRGDNSDIILQHKEKPRTRIGGVRAAA